MIVFNANFAVVTKHAKEGLELLRDVYFLGDCYNHSIFCFAFSCMAQQSKCNIMMLSSFLYFQINQYFQRDICHLVMTTTLHCHPHWPLQLQRAVPVISHGQPHLLEFYQKRANPSQHHQVQKPWHHWISHGSLPSSTVVVKWAQQHPETVSSLVVLNTMRWQQHHVIKLLCQPDPATHLL